MIVTLWKGAASGKERTGWTPGLGMLGSVAPLPFSLLGALERLELELGARAAGSWLRGFHPHAHLARSFHPFFTTCILCH